MAAVKSQKCCKFYFLIIYQSCSYISILMSLYSHYHSWVIAGFCYYCLWSCRITSHQLPLSNWLQKTEFGHYFFSMYRNTVSFTACTLGPSFSPWCIKFSMIFLSNYCPISQSMIFSTQNSLPFNQHITFIYVGSSPAISFLTPCLFYWPLCLLSPNKHLLWLMMSLLLGLFSSQ
jgi:hypothetical protein